MNTSGQLSVSMGSSSKTLKTNESSTCQCTHPKQNTAGEKKNRGVLGLAEGELIFPLAALRMLCFALIAGRVLITH